MKSRCAKSCNSTSKSKATKPTWHTAPSRPSGMHPERYSLILLDVMMGEMSGFRDGAAPASRIPKRPRVPVIFCTAKDSEDDTVAGTEHRSRRLHHQTLFGPRSAGPRAQPYCAAPSACTRRIRAGRSRFRVWTSTSARKVCTARRQRRWHLTKKGVRNPGPAALEPRRDLFARGDTAPASGATR